MKPLLVLLWFFIMSPAVRAAEVVLVNWNQTWDYMQPMGLDPALADADFNTTWFQKPADYAVNYNGPVIGGATVTGNPGNTATFDSGAGPGPLGYEVIDYFSSGGAEVTAFGTTLTQPTAGNRGAAYFRTTFTTAQPFFFPRLRMLLDDGALVYLDGVLVARVNKADNVEGYTQFAADTVTVCGNTEACIQTIPLATAGTGTQADSFVSVTVPHLAAGAHSLAVSARSNNATSSDLCMALQLLAHDEVTQTLPLLNGRNYIGAHVLNPPHGSAVATSAPGSTIVFAAPGWVNLVSGRAYEVEHPTIGYWDLVTSWNNGTRTVTLSSPWPTGPSPSPVIRQVKTLDQLFGTAFNLAQIKAGTALMADKIWVPNGLGTGYYKYFRHGFSGTWRRVGGGAVNRANAPIHLIQGMIYERVGVPAISLEFTGHPVTTPKQFLVGGVATKSLLTNPGGPDLISSVFGLSTPLVPAKTMATCGLFATAVAGADFVIIQDSALSLIQCYSNGANWEDTNTNDVSNLLLSSGFNYLPSVPVNFTLTP